MDIVEQLRSPHSIIRLGATTKAADEIERLREQVEKLRQQLADCDGALAGAEGR